MNQTKKRCTAIVLAAGSGSRMKSKVAKQFMMLDGKPLIWYALQAIENSQIIDDCILVTGAEDIDYVRKEIVEHYGFHKVDIITAGGAERYLSVGNALRIIADDDMRVPNHDGYVFIHDGARPFLTMRTTFPMSVWLVAPVTSISTQSPGSAAPRSKIVVLKSRVLPIACVGFRREYPSTMTSTRLPTNAA